MSDGSWQVRDSTSDKVKLGLLQLGRHAHLSFQASKRLIQPDEPNLAASKYKVI